MSFNLSGITMNSAARGYFFGTIGVACFSLTLPATRFAIQDIDPTVVALGRALVAAVLALVALRLNREKIPAREHWLSLALVAGGAVIGFPVFTSWAMTYVDASHGAIVLGVLPLATACFAVLVGHERPSLAFWLAALFGSFVVVGYSVQQAKGHFAIYDLILFGAVFSAGMAYAVGAKLAKSIGSWQVICWALLLSVPFIFPFLVVRLLQAGFKPGVPSLIGFIYVSMVSMFLGFFAWYKGLALGGTAKVGLIQLLQPFMTIAASALLLGERVSFNTLLIAVAVSASVLFALRARIGFANKGIAALQPSTEGSET